MSDETGAPKETDMEEMWLSFDRDDGITTHKTQAKAIEEAGKDIECWRDQCDPEWPDGVEAGLVAKITHVVDIISRSPGDRSPDNPSGQDEFIDYGLVHVTRRAEKSIVSELKEWIAGRRKLSAETKDFVRDQVLGHVEAEISRLEEEDEKRDAGVTEASDDSNVEGGGSNPPRPAKALEVEVEHCLNRLAQEIDYARRHEHGGSPRNVLRKSLKRTRSKLAVAYVEYKRQVRIAAHRRGPGEVNPNVQKGK